MTDHEKQLRSKALSLLLTGKTAADIKEAARLAMQVDILSNDQSLAEFAQDVFGEAICPSV